jgi:hypothetical protein
MTLNRLPPSVRPQLLRAVLGTDLRIKHRQIDANKHNEVQQRGQQNATDLRL